MRTIILTFARLVWRADFATAAVQALHEWIETAVTSEKITWGHCWTPKRLRAVLAPVNNG